MFFCFCSVCVCVIFSVLKTVFNKPKVLEAVAAICLFSVDTHFTQHIKNGTSNKVQMTFEDCTE